jgi:two-component system CitB family sensor kinase
VKHRWLHYRHFKLNTRLIAVLCLMSALQASLIGGFAWYQLRESLDNEIGNRALNVSKTIAAMPDVIRAIEKRDSTTLNQISSKLAATNNALFIVIGDKNGIRLAHPNPDRIGKSMADDDGDTGDTALINGQGYVDKALGSLGLSMRGKAPVYDEAGESIIGIVSVGYSLSQVQSAINSYTRWLFGVLFVALVGSVFVAIVIARRFKREIFGLEPDQIARLFEERDATLESVREGIIAINREGLITTFNRNAIHTLGLDSSSDIIGKSISDVLPDSGMLSVLEDGEPQFDLEIWLNSRAMIVNRLPLKQGEELIGAVSSFRPKNEVDLVSEKLSRIQLFADSLRSQAHEYSNKLHTIAGLIQLGANEEALRLITHETADHQSFIEGLMDAVIDPLLAGCLIGKYNRARELGLHLQVERDSQMLEIPQQLSSEQLVSCLGNLIDNALEATRLHHGPEGVVSVSMTDLGDDLIFDVVDQGGGLSVEAQSKIFDKGYSSKNDSNHGLGLYLVMDYVTKHGGNIEVQSTLGTGSRFTLYLPKRAMLKGEAP